MDIFLVLCMRSFVFETDIKSLCVVNTRYATEICCIGVDFVTKKRGLLAEKVARLFMTRKMNIKDETFMTSAMPHIIVWVDKAYKNYNNGRTNVYRKQLKACKLCVF